MYGERNMETYTTICKIDSQWEFAVCLRELRGSVPPYRGGIGRKMGGRFKAEGTYVYLWFIHVEVDRKQQNYEKQLYFNLKSKLTFKK